MEEGQKKELCQPKFQRFGWKNQGRVAKLGKKKWQ